MPLYALKQSVLKNISNFRFKLQSIRFKPLISVLELAKSVPYCLNQLAGSYSNSSFTKSHK